MHPKNKHESPIKTKVSAPLLNSSSDVTGNSRSAMNYKHC